MKTIIIVVSVIIIIFFLINTNTTEPFELKLEKPSLDLLKSPVEITGMSLCSEYASQPTVLNDKCGTLTEKNCNSTSCCIWLNGSSCVAGGANGPTFRTNKGKDVIVDNYYYMGTLNKNAAK